MSSKIIFLILNLTICLHLAGQDNKLNYKPTSKLITIADTENNLALTIDCSMGCKITALNVKGKNILSPSGIYTGIRTQEDTFGSYATSGDLKINKGQNKISIDNIVYGNNDIKITESWHFELAGNCIKWNISREYGNQYQLEEMAFPQWSFASNSIWKGGILDNGGMVWCKYLQVNDSYGIHTGGVTFWNPESGNALRISTRSDENKHIATKYSQNENKEFTCTHFVTDSVLGQRYNLNRFIYGKPDVFAPFEVKKGDAQIEIELQYIDYNKEYSRGNLTGIDSVAVRELLNTTGRYGVVDKNIVGGNGWITNWKCLHEPFFAQIGMALNDKNYTANMSSTLDQERDQAILANGRVLSRWHNAAGDEIPGTYNPETGYYEAMWGYTIDSQTGYVINTSEQFDLCGDINWLRTHKASCEKALDWLINRDSNNNGIFEMMNNNISDQKASDWVDIVWASFENAFVNAQMYEALKQWANCELILGDQAKADYYHTIAEKLKVAYNKPVNEGGFWYPEKNQYIYWRDKDGSIHGDNIVTPVNFAAIAFGICDNPERISRILDQIEQRTTAENLFHWPLCMDSFRKEEVHSNNWPFPNYENGDIFPTWGYMGIRAYADYNKDIALKYIKALLKQYNKDGLSSQRFSRTTQQGVGTDILAGICTSITALYRDIYGIRPKWNRMGLEPHINESLNGTSFNYTLRDVDYRIELSTDKYSMTTDGFSISGPLKFGANQTGKELIYYPENKEINLFKIKASSGNQIRLKINSWKENEYSWNIASSDKYEFILSELQPDAKYQLFINNKKQDIKTDKNGTLLFKNNCQSGTLFKVIKL